MLKKCIRGLITSLLLICSLFVFAGCSSGSKYEKAAKEEAEKVLKEEADNVSWTTVKTGKLEYMYTVYNEEIDKYRVFYFAKFEQADDPDYNYLGIEITLNGSDLSVSDSSPIYYREEDYKREKKASKEQIIKDSEGTWEPAK